MEKEEKSCLTPLLNIFQGVSSTLDEGETVGLQGFFEDPGRLINKDKARGIGHNLHAD